MKCPEPEETFDWKDYMFANVAQVNAVDEVKLEKKQCEFFLE